MVSQPVASPGRGFAVAVQARWGRQHMLPLPFSEPLAQAEGAFLALPAAKPGLAGIHCSRAPPCTEGLQRARPPLLLHSGQQRVQASAAGVGKWPCRGSPKLRPWPGLLPTLQPMPLKQSKHRLRNLFPAACAQPLEATLWSHTVARAVTETPRFHCS